MSNLVGCGRARELCAMSVPVEEAPEKCRRLWVMEPSDACAMLGPVRLHHIYSPRCINSIGVGDKFSRLPPLAL